MSRRSRTTWVVVVVGVVAVLVILAIVAASRPPQRTAGSPAPAATASIAGAPTTPSASVVPGAGGSLVDMIGLLPVRPERRQGYERDLFNHWIDADGDGCNARREVLIDEAVEPPAVGDRCDLSGGRWRSVYDGVEVTDAAELDIDHVVALAEAWDSGAYAWSPERREAFANDLGVPWALVAVTGGSNRSKSDLDPADWMPPLQEAGCAFVADWVAVKIRWSLAVDRAEQRALLEEAAGCGTTAMPSIPVQ